MIFTVDGSSFLKVIDEQNSLCIPKYRGQNLTCWCLRLWWLWTAFTSCCPLSWLLIWLHNEVVDPCFIHYHIFMQKFLFVALIQLQKILWIIDVLFLIDCEQTQHPLWTQLSHWQMFIKMVNTLPSDVFNSSAISRNFNLRLAKMSLWIFFVFSRTTTKFGQPERLAFVSVWPHLK